MATNGDDTRLRVIQRYAIAVEFFFSFGFAAFQAFSVASMLEVGWTPAMAAQIVLWTYVLTLVCQPLLGRLADRRWGEKKLVTRFLFIFALNLALVPLTLRSGLRWPVVLSNLASTFFGAQMMSFLDAWLIGLKQDHPDFNYGLMRGIGSVAFAIGALVLGPLSQSFGLEFRYYVGAASVFLTVYFAWRLPAPGHHRAALTEPELTAAQPGPEPMSAGRSFRELSGIPGFLLLLLSVFLINVGHTSLMTMHTVILRELGGNAAHIGTNAAINAFIELPAMIIVGRLYPRKRASSLFLIAGLSYALRVVLAGFVSSIPAFFAIQILQALSFGVLVPTAMNYLGEILPGRVRATGFALYGAIGSAGAGIFSNFLNSALLAQGLETQSIMLIIALFCLLGCGLILWGRAKKIW